MAKNTLYDWKKVMSKEYIEIDGRKIGPDFEPYIIAELSANHNGDINRAFEILEMAKECGADAIKLQTYTQDTLTIKCDKPDFMINGGLWNGRTLYDLYTEAHMPWEWHEPLFAKAKELGITIFSSPFDETAVDLLESLGCPAYKIASFEAVDIPLIRYVAKTGKPMIISTGMANEKEIEEAINAARNGGCKQLVVLHCVSGYPAPAEDYNLKTISNISERFDVLVGLSDHTVDNATAVTSVALGACLIEKHVTLDRQGGGPDDSFSLEKPELTQLCKDSKTAWKSIGKVNYERKESEKSNMIFRRSLYAVEDIQAGERFTKKNVRSIRPGYGLPPQYIEELVEKKSAYNIERGTPISFELIEK
jgi:N-acetylneuraminate synthase